MRDKKTVLYLLTVAMLFTLPAQAKAKKAPTGVRMEYIQSYSPDKAGIAKLEDHLAKGWGQQISNTDWLTECLVGYQQDSKDVNISYIATQAYTNKCARPVYRHELLSGSSPVGYLLGIPEKDGKYGYYRFVNGAAPQGDSPQQGAPATSSGAISDEEAAQMFGIETSQASNTPVTPTVQYATLTMYVYGKVADVDQAAGAIGCRKWEKGDASVCVFPNYPVRTNEKDATGNQISQVLTAFRPCKGDPTGKSVSHAASFSGLVDNGSGKCNAAAALWFAADQGYYLMVSTVSAQPAAQGEATGTQPAPSVVITTDDLAQLSASAAKAGSAATQPPIAQASFGSAPAPENSGWCSSATSTLMKLANAQALRQLALFRAIDALAKDQKLGDFLNELDAKENEGKVIVVSVESISGAEPIAKATISAAPAQASPDTFIFFSDEFRAFYYPKAAGEIAKKRLVNVEYDWRIETGNAAAKTAKIKRYTGRLEGIETTSSGRVLLNLGNAKADMCSDNTSFVSKKHTAEVVTLNAFKVLVCPPAPVADAKK